MKIKKILITGIHGLVGKSLVKRLQMNNDFEIYGISHSRTSDKIFKIDLSQEWEESILPKKMDIVIHLAQSEHFREFPEKAINIFNVNTSSTAKLLNYAKNAGAIKFIYASSGGVYGYSDKPFNESFNIDIHKNLGFYLTTKLTSELLVNNYSPYFSTDILRFFFVYGEDQKKDMLIPRLIDSVKNDVPINLQGKDGLKLNPIYVEDAVNSIIKCFDLSGNNLINIAGTQIYSLKQMCDIIGNALSKRPVYKLESIEPKSLMADISLMKKKLTVPEINFEKAIVKLISNG